MERGSSDELRFRGVYEATYRDLLAYARRRCDSHADADDLVAEVFTIAWRRLEVVPEGDATRLWLFGVARNVLNNQRRSGRRASRFLARYRPAASEVPMDVKPLRARFRAALVRASMITGNSSRAT